MLEAEFSDLWVDAGELGGLQNHHRADALLHGSLECPGDVVSTVRLDARDCDAEAASRVVGLLQERGMLDGVRTPEGGDPAETRDDFFQQLEPLAAHLGSKKGQARNVSPGTCE